MTRNPDQCRFRIVPECAGASDQARCGVVARIVNVSDESICGVTPQICQACCACLRSGEDLNPVVASMVYSAAGKIVKEGGLPGCDRESARMLQERVVPHLGMVAPALPDRIFPPQSPPPECTSVPASASIERAGTRESLVVGVLTAPRGEPLLGATLRSLHAAGFDRLSIFAEPGTPIPAEARGHEIHVPESQLGNFTNFYNALVTLYHGDPEARGVILFQDDVDVAAGMKEWCDRELFPLGHGLVSLFTPRMHSDVRPGWRVLSPGYFRIWGGQAFALRRDVLEQFLSDPQVLRRIRTGAHADDAVFSGWATRRSGGIAFHTPSLVQHTGRVSSLWGTNGPDRRVTAHAVNSVADIAAWRLPERRQGRVGLVGPGGASGLGYLNADLARCFEIDRWLMPFGSHEPRHAYARVPCRVERVPRNAARATIRNWMKGLDWVLFCERPFSEHVAPLARSASASIAVVVNWEWLDPEMHWLRIADLLIAPTRFTYRYLCDFRQRHGFGWDVVSFPWPVDTGQFRFQERRHCERFLFVDGHGGARATRLDGSPTADGRKGMDVMAEAMWAAPKLRFLVYSQRRELPRLPSNVEVRPAPARRRDLYHEGDVCVQPSHVEGIGLPLLECQAAGMPLITTDAPPMNEHNPWVTIPVERAETVLYGGHQPVPWQQIDGRRLAQLLEEVAGANLTGASARAREFIAAEHNWAKAAAQLRALFVVP